MENTIIWKDVAGYEGLYRISNTGLIQSTFTTTNLYQEIHNGYYRVKLCKGKKSKNFKVHRLVALNFIPNPLAKLQINHKDGNKLNNNVSNLEWVTGFENIEHAIEMQLIKRKLKYEDVVFIMENQHLGKKKLGKMFNVDPTTIKSVRQGRSYRKDIELWEQLKSFNSPYPA